MGDATRVTIQVTGTFVLCRIDETSQAHWKIKIVDRARASQLDQSTGMAAVNQGWPKEGSSQRRGVDCDKDS